MHALGAVVLAAGVSERFGADNKLLAKIDGEPLIRRVVREIIGSGIAEVVVVTGYDEAKITAALEGLAIRCAHNGDWRSGMGRSIAAGIGALRADILGAFVVPGDMPRLTSNLLVRIASAFEKSGRSVVFPVTANGDQRNPVLWPRRHFEKLVRLAGPRGAKGLLGLRDVEGLGVPVHDEAILEDIDTLDDLQRPQ
jgi:molybdenum cofactor cytidylyltransferase